MSDSESDHEHMETNETEMETEPTTTDNSKKEEDITNDGGVIKKVIKEGEGWKTPSKGAEVKCHYVGTLLDGTQFDSSRERNQPFEFVLGQNQVIRAWEEGIKTMKKGEICELICKPEYAYGENGSPPKIPGNATLKFEIELLSWTEEKDVSEKKDGGIMKKTLEEGDGWETPNELCKVKINYTLRDSKGNLIEEKTDFEFVCGEEQVPLGLDQGVQSMKKKEKSILKVKPPYCSTQYDSESHVEYTVELLELEKEKSSWDMSFEEKLEIATRRKEEGNELFKQKKYERALKRYKKALDYFQNDSSLKDEEKKKASALKLPCYLNTAVCLMKTKSWKEVIENCNKALEIDPANVKALYRKGSALIDLDDWEQAKLCLEKALQHDPSNKEIKQEIARLRKKITEQNQKDKKIFSGMFERLRKQGEVIRRR